MTEPTGEHAQPRRHRGRRPRPRQNRARRRPATPARIVHEYSAGGLVVDGLDREVQVAALIGKAGRHGRTCWMLPKGHIEIGERAEQTAIREIAEETGIHGDVLAHLGTIDYWFRADDHVVHKTVHHYLVRLIDGELAADDHEVDEIAWVPLHELPIRLGYPDERKLSEVAAHLIAMLRSHGRAALPPLPHTSPRRRRQTHSIARRHRFGNMKEPPACNSR
jgi:ADP-ribose pyrophosphatase YjhB (NUDIX family)